MICTNLENNKILFSIKAFLPPGRGFRYYVVTEMNPALPSCPHAGNGPPQQKLGRDLCSLLLTHLNTHLCGSTRLGSGEGGDGNPMCLFTLPQCLFAQHT